MARNTQTMARKTASQARSRATVEAILEATARILIKEGFDKASTNRVAEVAGVSVGSLYQYFPSKDALVAALIARHGADIRRTIGDELVQAVKLPVADGVRKLVSSAIKSHRIDPKLHRALTEQIPRVGHQAKIDAHKREYFCLFRDYLESRKSEIRVRDLDLATFICVTTIEGLTHNAVLDSKMVSDNSVKTLVDECTRLLVGYLKGAYGKGHSANG
jgi:AcrR family transcriptional regulator